MEMSGKMTIFKCLHSHCISHHHHCVFIIFLAYYWVQDGWEVTQVRVLHLAFLYCKWKRKCRVCFHLVWLWLHLHYTFRKLWILNEYFYVIKCVHVTTGVSVHQHKRTILNMVCILAWIYWTILFYFILFKPSS